MTSDSLWDYTVLVLILVPCVLYILHRARHLFSKGGGCAGCPGGANCGGARTGKAE